MKKTLTVTIPAFNEEKSIKKTILDIFKQKNQKYLLKNVTVYCDNSTDSTPQIVQSLQSQFPELSLKMGKERKGKYQLINQMFKDCTTDVIIILDADIKIVGNDFFEKLINVIENDPTSNMVAAHNVMLRPKTWIGKMLYTHQLIWDNVRWSAPNLDYAENFFGTATAFTYSYAKKINILPSITDPHLYMFLISDETSGFRYCLDAVVQQWPITNFSDLHKFLKRSLGKEDLLLEKMFGDKVKHAYDITLKSKILGVIKTFKQEPFFTPLGLFLILYTKIALLFIKTDEKAIWETVASTKKNHSSYEK